MAKNKEIKVIQTSSKGGIKTANFFAGLLGLLAILMVAVAGFSSLEREYGYVVRFEDYDGAVITSFTVDPEINADIYDEASRVKPTASFTNYLEEEYTWSGRWNHSLEDLSNVKSSMTIRPTYYDQNGKESVYKEDLIFQIKKFIHDWKWPWEPAEEEA